MRKSSGGKHFKKVMGRRSLLRLQVKEASSKIWSALLTLVLVLSLVPAQSVAYAIAETMEEPAAIEETVPVEEPAAVEEPAPVEEAAPAEESTPAEEVVPAEPENSESEEPAPVAEPEDEPAPAADPAIKPTTEPSPADEPQATNVTTSVAKTVRSTVRAKGPALRANAGPEVTATITVDGTAVDGTVYSKTQVTATLAVEGVDASAIKSVATPDGVTYNAGTLTVTKSTDFSGVVVTYTYEDSDTGEEAEGTVNATASASVVIDTVKPTIDVKIVPSKSADDPVPTYATNNYNLESNQLYVKVVVEDNEAVGPITATVEWEFDNSSATDGLPDPVEITFSKSGDKYVGYAGPYSASDFVVGDKLVVGTVTANADDMAGNSADQKTSTFTSETKILNDILNPAKKENVTVARAEGTLEGEKDGATIYSGPVSITLENGAQELNYTIKDNNSAITGTTISAAGDHSVTVDFTAKGEYGTNKATKTVTVTPDGATFTIDTTVPAITALTLSDPSNPDAVSDGDLPRYGGGNPLTVTITANNTSTLDSYAFVLDDGETQTTIDPEQNSDGSYTIEAPKENVEYTLIVTPKTIFEDDDRPVSKSTGPFVIDTEAPKVTLSFSGPGAFADEANTIAGFFKWAKEGDATYNVGDIGALTITVTDGSPLANVSIVGLKDAKLDPDTGEMSFSEIEDYEVTLGDDATEATVVVPYFRTDDGIVIGEGDGLTIKVTATDGAGNEKVYSYDPQTPEDDPDKTVLPDENKGAQDTTFVVDITPVRFISNSITEETPAYTEGNVKVFDASSLDFDITLTDEHFSSKDSKIFVNGSEVDVTWSGEKPSYAATVTLEEPDGYERELNEVSGSANDYLGNKTLKFNLTDSGETWSYGYIALDSKAPENLSATYSIDPITENFSGVNYYNNSVSVTFTASDPWFDTENSTIDGEKVSWTESSSEPGVWEATVTYSGEGVKYTPTLVAVDLLKHEATITEPSFIIDRSAPTIAGVSVTTRPTSNGVDGGTGGDPIQFFNQATEMTFSVADNIGIKEVKLDDPEGQYTVASGSTGISEGAKEGSFTIRLVDSTSSVTEYERDIVLTVTDLANNTRTWTIDRTGVVTSTNVTGNVGNESINGEGIFPFALIQDVTAPEVSLSGPAAGSYLTGSATVASTVTEANFNYLQRFDPSRGILHITKQEGNAGRATSTRDIPASAFSGSGSSWNATETFSEDGHYTVEASFKDFANNSSNVVKVGEFTIDNTAPVIESIVFDNNNVRNGKYYNAGRTATITVIEHNWDESKAVITSNGVISGWSTSGDTHVATVSFLNDGDYNLSVSVTDLAGNSATDNTVPDFTIDLTAPKIEFDNVTANTAYNGAIAPDIIYTDEKNFDQSGIEFTIVGSKHGSTYSSQLATGTVFGDNTATTSFTDFTREVEYDDIYTIHAHMVDLAGNEAENSITFSVNRFGSNFIIVNADELEGPRGNGYLPEPVEVLIEEINVSGADSKEHGVSVTRGLETENLELLKSASPNSEGYYVEDVNDSAHWSHFTYHVYKPNFDVDGNYTVVVSSNDYATNKNNSSSYYNPADHEVADASASFILDTTDPIIEGLSITPTTRENVAALDVTFTVTDNIAIDTVEVTLDGETQLVTPDKTGLCTVTVDAKSFTARSLDILATDLAGRTASENVSGFHVTTNFFENYWPLLAGGGVIGAGGAWWFLAGKRRKKDEEEEETAA